jgi:hypothetical protein
MYSGQGFPNVITEDYVSRLVGHNIPLLLYLQLETHSLRKTM